MCAQTIIHLFCRTLYIPLLLIPNQGNICLYARGEVSVLTESPLGHLCCIITDVPPQPNSQPVHVLYKHAINKLARSIWYLVRSLGSVRFPPFVLSQISAFVAPMTRPCRSSPSYSLLHRARICNRLSHSVLPPFELLFNAQSQRVH